MIENGNLELDLTKINYSDLLEIGFKRIDCEEDICYQMQYGYPYFFLAYGEEKDQVTMEWSPSTREVNLYLNSQTYQTALTLFEVKKIVKMLEEEM
jgi:hypothetical protein